MPTSDAASTRFEAASSALDAVNAHDPRVLIVRGQQRPWTLGEAELATIWLHDLRPDASEPLRLAVRAHHLRRWETPRTSYPKGRAGYLKWRKHLYDVAADHAGAILRDVGYSEDVIARTSEIMHKKNLKDDADAQTYEDVLCIVFLESQYDDFVARTDPSKIEGIVSKTLAKMSPESIAAWQAFSR